MRQSDHLPYYTIEDYKHWEGEWELIHGIPWAMSPSPTRKHQKFSVILSTTIANVLKDRCTNCEVLHELDWAVDNDTVLRPDVVITCDDQGDFITKPPVLIVEIISPSTAIKDRRSKFNIYQEQAVKYYILADPNNQTFSVFALVDGSYQEQNTLCDFIIHDGCTVHLDVQAALIELDA